MGAQGIAGLLAQITAGIAIDGIPAITDLIGKRDVDVQLKFWQDWFEQALKPAIDSSAQGIAGLLAQITAGIAIDGIPAITDLIGKRDVESQERFISIITGITQQVVDTLKPIINESVQNAALTLTQILANIADNGILPSIG